MGQTRTRLSFNWYFPLCDLVFYYSIGATAIEDKIQPGAKNVLNFCQDCGIHVSVATGDSENTAVAIMRQLEQIHVDPVYLIGTDPNNTQDLDKKLHELLNRF